jgi:hypothetical protein
MMNQQLKHPKIKRESKFGTTNTSLSLHMKEDYTTANQLPELQMQNPNSKSTSPKFTMQNQQLLSSS